MINKITHGYQLVIWWTKSLCIINNYYPENIDNLSFIYIYLKLYLTIMKKIQ
jgi:hypothetical protein